jgi:hypothetical protein
MPLLDHFHPPLSQRRHWDSFHGAWAEAIALTLNQSLLPPRYVAEARVKIGGQVEIDSFEVVVVNDEEGPKVVAAIELVSPANKDRPASRRQFAVKCASYLYAGAGLMMVDVVTSRGGNLHTDLLELLQVKAAGQETGDLYAAAYQPRPAPDASRLAMWVERLTIGHGLPTLPLWIGPAVCVPVDLEETYLAACAARRIDGVSET